VDLTTPQITLGFHLTSMSLSSKLRKIKPKGTVQELKLVHTINRRGADTIKTEEVKTPQREAPSTSQHGRSSSPIKRLKLDTSDIGSIPFVLESPDISKKRQTLVCLLPSSSNSMLNYFQGQNDYLRQFLGHEKSYLDHLLDLELPPSDLPCTTCANPKAQFRCLDCYGPHWWCQSCLLKSHRHHPFHRPQHWKDGSFENVAFSDLGYVFILGHSKSGHYCKNNGDLFGDRRMTLIHVNGIFQLCVRFCRCQGASSDHEQLFSHRLFPSSFDRPETAFTLDVLNYYGIDALECKTSAHSFFQKLRRVTNNAFPDEVPVSPTFLIN
jgi:hypothetical protein